MNNLRICTWNIKLGVKLPLILNEIKENEAFRDLDILGLQEASVHNNVEDSSVIAKILGEKYEYFQVSTDMLKGMPQANAVIWNKNKFKIDKIGSFSLPRKHQNELSKIERLFLAFVKGRQRNSISVEGKFEKRSIRIYVSHLDVVGFHHKVSQINSILEDNEAKKTVDIACIMGDLNTFKLRSKPAWTKIAENVERKGFKDLTSEVLWTFKFSKIRISQKLDAIFLKPNDMDYKSWTLDVAGSDHIPVFADIFI